MEESLPQEGLSLEDALKTLIAELPLPVQKFVMSPARDSVALSLSQKYGLHVDQAGTFQLEYLHMLLGISSPEEFVSSLKKAGISEEAVKGLTNDVNEQVFKKLRSEEINAQPVPATSVKQPVPTPQPVAVNQPPIQAPQPLPVKLPEELAGATLRTMATDMMAVSEHKVPEPIPYKQVMPIARPAVQPVQNTYSEVLAPPSKSPPPVNLPGQTPPPLIKEYSVDPYKEPF